MTKLKIADDLALPLEAVTEALGFLGRRGSGKTYAAQKLAEEMHRAGAQFVVMDPVGVWYGLRLAANGKDPGIPIPVLGGLRGDVPIEPAAGRLIADLVVDKATSVVVDVSQFESDADKARFATEFVNRFFFRKKSSPSAVHVFIEECQELIPQNPMRDEARMLHAFNRLVKIGRNFGIGVSLISQRPQEVNKKVLNLVELLFAFQMTGPQERKTIQGWIADKGLDEDIAGELPKLKRGHPHAWSPAWLQISRVVSISEKWTLDASSTPKVGVGQKVRELAPIDIEQLGAEIKATAERAKAEDPRELKRQLGELRRQLTVAQKAGGTVERKVTDQAAIDRAVESAVRKVRSQIKAEATSVRRSLGRLNAIAHEAVDLLDPAIATLDINFIEASKSGSQPVASAAARTENSITGDQRLPSTGRSDVPRAAPVLRQSPSRSRREPVAVGDFKISGTQQRMLDALALFESLGLNTASRAMVAGFCAISHTTGSFSNNLSALRTAGLIEDDADGDVALTDTGRSVASAPSSPPSLDELHRTWYGKLSGTQARMLEQAVHAYPEGVEREDIAGALGIQAGTGSFSNNLSKLRTLGVLKDLSRTSVVAGSVLFPPGVS